MKLVGATAYVLCIPLVAGFDHHTCRRRHSDSVVLEVVDDEGYRGFGEGAPRPYVTGETSETVVDHLHRSWRIAERACAAGLFVQVGGHVGETAILAAAGRHLAAAFDEVVAAEGSFGELVLVEDVARDPVRFGHGGAGGVLTGLGLGLEVRRGVLERWAEQVVDLGRAGIDARRPLPPHFVCADGAPGTRSVQKGRWP
jgi:L-alanine-DL-glutamate epimerase-like enolase superfamily enzyme